MNCACCPRPARRAFLAGAAALLVASPARAVTLDECGSPGVSIEVRGEKIRPRYDFSATRQSLRQLQAQARPADASRTDHGASVVGMTTCRFLVTHEVRVFQARVGGRDCIVPSLVRIVFSQTDHAILVAADGTAAGSCGRNVVLEHEARHAAVNDRTIDDGRRRIDAALREIRPRLGPVWDRNYSPDEAAQRFLAKLKPIVDEAVKAAMATNARENEAMDSPQAYRRDWSRCGGAPN